MEAERILRQAICLKALQTVRATLVQKLRLVKAKCQVHGVIGTTRAESLLLRLSSRLDHARWEYTNSQTQLIQLGLTSQETWTFLPLTDSDIKGLTAALKGQDRLGDGYARVPWYWCVSMASKTEDSSHISTTGEALRKEYKESRHYIIAHPSLLRVK